MRSASVACLLTLTAFLSALPFALSSCTPEGGGQAATGSSALLPAPTPQPVLNPNLVLADYGQEEVTTGDLIRFSADIHNLLANLHRAPQNQREDAVRNMVRQQVLRQKLASRAREAGLADDEFVQEQIRQVGFDLAREAWNRLINQRMEPVSESEIRAEYKRNIDRYKTIGSLSFQFIFVPTDQLEDSPAARDQARRRAEKALALVRSGSDFAKVAKEYSYSKTEPGAVITEKLGKLNIKIEDALLQLDKGGVSEVVPITYGFQILRLVDYTPTNVRPLEDVRPMVLGYLREQKREQAEEELYREVLADPELQGHYETHFYRAGRPDAPDDEIIFRVGKDLFTAADYRRIYSTTTDLVRKNLETPEGRKIYLEEAAFRPQLFNHAMIEYGLLEQEDYRRRFEAERERILAQAWMDQQYQQFLAQLEFGDDAVQAFYEEHRRDFTAPAAYAIQELTVEAGVTEEMSREERNRAMEEARAKGLELLTALRSGQNPADARARLYPNSELVQYTETPLQPLVEYPRLIRGKLSGRPVGLIEDVIPLDGAYAIVKITQVREPAPQPLAEVRAQIEAALSARDWNERRLALEEELVGGDELQFREASINDLVQRVNELENQPDAGEDAASA